MRRNRVRIFGLLFMAVALLPLPAAFGQADIEVPLNEVVVRFPSGVIFALEASSAETIEAVSLFYGTSGRTCQPGAARQAFEFERGPEVSLEWQWEWKRSGILPPGSEIWWEWEIRSGSGEVLRLPRETITIEDVRHDWQVIDEDGIVLRWHTGDAAFGRALHTISVESLERLSREMDIHPDGVTQITIYPTPEELRETLLVSPEWTGGRAFPDYNSFIFAVQPHELGWAATVIPHELTHLVVDARFLNCRGAFLPTWLSEGLAEYGEGSDLTTRMGPILDMLEDESLPPLRSLASGFSAYGESARLSYTQSGLVVTYLYDEYGQAEVLALVDTLRDGNTIDQSLEEVFGFDTDGLDRAWRASLGFTQPEAPQSGSQGDDPTRTPIPTLPLLGLDIEPTPEPTSTPPPPPTLNVPAEPAGQVSPPADPGEPAQTPLPEIVQNPGGDGLPGWAVLGAGGGVLVLLVVVLYLRFFRR